MSSLISTTLVENALISEISPSLNYAVVSGPSKSTYTTSNASTFSNSVVQFTVKTPNQSVLIDRAVKMSARLTLKFNIGGPVGSKYSVPFDEDEPAEDQVTVFEYSNTESFQAYPLNSLITNSNIEINNAGVSCSNMDLKDILSTLTDHRALNKKNSSTPSYYDSIYGEYEDCVGATNSPLAGSFSNSLDDSYQGRGGHPVTMIVQHYDAAGDEYPLVADPDGDENGFYSCLKPAAEGDTWIIYLTGDFTENFLYLSPLLSTLSHDQQGMMGVNDININLNIDSECKRVFSTAKTVYDPEVENSLRPLYISKIAIEKDDGSVGWENLKMSFNFLTLQSSQLARIKEPTQVLPYMKFDRFITSSNGALVIDPQATGVIISNAISLTSVPDRIFVAARIPISSQNSACPSSFLAMENINVSFDNGDGALANCSVVDLFSLSQKNGSAQTFSSFKGVMSVHSAAEVQKFKQIPSFGSVLCIDPANDLNLPEFITNGSIGSYNLSITVKVKNYHSYPIKPELVIITSNSGVFKIQSGVSSVYTSLLTAKMVMDAKSGSVSKISGDDYKKLLGGVSPALNPLQSFRRNKNKPYPDGGGMSASGSSGGGISGSGRRIDQLY